MGKYKPLLNKAVSIHQQGNLDAALKLYQEVVFQYPKAADAYHLMGVAHLQNQQPDKALVCISQAIEINGKNAFYFSNLGIAQLDLEMYQEAISSFQTALHLNPSLSEASFNLGNSYYALHQYQLAIISYKHAIDIDDSHAAFHLNLANAYKQLGEFSSALDSYDLSLSLNGVDISIWLNKGLCLQAMEEPLKAMYCFQQVVNMNPEHWEARWTLGRLCMNLNLWPDAINNLTLAGTGMSESWEFWNDLGIALDKAGIPAEAVIAFEKSLSLNPNSEVSTNNLGSVLHGMQRFSDALGKYEKALLIRPDYKEAHVNKAFTLLLNGHLSEGFDNYEYRNMQGELRPIWLSGDKPSWTGLQDLKGKTLLVYAEQGFGDTIQFVRYLDLLAPSATCIVLAVQQSLLNLFSGNIHVSKLVSLNEEFTDFDFHVSLLSLPQILGTVIQTIPNQTSFIQVHEDVALKWKDVLGKKNRPRVGLVWSGSATHANDLNRSFSLQTLLAYLPDDFEYIALQKEVRPSDKDALVASNIQSFASEIQDFQDTAAICQQLDLIISVDTSVAHLSASLGCETWILLPQVPDWRWFLSREDSPWYPTVRLFRQEAAGDWAAVLKRVHTSLRQSLL